MPYYAASAASWRHKPYVEISGALVKNRSELAMLVKCDHNYHTALQKVILYDHFWTISGHFRAYLAL